MRVLEIASTNRVFHFQSLNMVIVKEVIKTFAVNPVLAIAVVVRCGSGSCWVDLVEVACPLRA